MIQQLSLNITLRDDATFANFCPGQNQVLLNLLQNTNEKFIYLYGNAACGLTHLLQAACHQANTCLYLPLKSFADFSPAILIDIATVDLLAIDDIEAIAGQSDWEEAIFHAYNALQIANKRFIIASHHPVNQLNLRLADLKSRLQAMLVLPVLQLNDAEKISALQQRAQLRGLTLNDEVATYILHHYSRDMATLIALLSELDKASLQAQRRLTIPFVKQVLNR